MNDDEILAEINAAIDKTLEEFSSRDDLFNNEEERRKFLYDKGYFQSNTWAKSNQCIYKGCTNKSVKSHTIQRSTSLSHIAENNHVLTPGFDFKNERYELLSVGINEASTFPGFCQEHELLFKDFEGSKDITTDNDCRFLIYRTICREIIANQKALKAQEYRLQQYLNIRNDKFDHALRDKIQHLLNNEIEYESTSYEHDSVAYRFITERNQVVTGYLNDCSLFHEKILNDISKNKAQKIYLRVAMTDFVIPCCLAGNASFRIKTKESGRMFVNILPYEGKTYIIFAALIKHKKWLDQYVENCTSNPFSIIKSVERLMIHYSDHWFLKPAVWKNLNEKIRIRFLESIITFNVDIPEKEIMVFTELREEIIAYLENGVLEISPDAIDVINQEKALLKYQRANY